MRKKKNITPIVVLLLFLLVFGGFIFLITRPSQYNIAISKLKNCNNVEDVKHIWIENKEKLSNNNDFSMAMRKRLSYFNLSVQEIKECNKWLPPIKSHLNLIVVPDLSLRIKQIPNQITRDKQMLKAIRNLFEQETFTKVSSKDKLTITVTDPNQAKGHFGNLADSLIVDLSKHHIGQSNRLFFTLEKKEKFEQAIDSLYSIAKGKPLGADYRSFVKNYLEEYIAPTTLFDIFENKLIILTDGYMEAQNRPADTQISRRGTVLNTKLRNGVEAGTTLETINNQQLNIKTFGKKFPDLEVLICEIKERKSGENYDFEILETYWQDWFIRMKVKEQDFKFLRQDYSINNTINKIKNFIQK